MLITRPGEIQLLQPIVGDKNKKGIIKIELRYISKGMEISIEDDGVGRLSDNHNTRGTGTGMRTIDQIITLYRELYATEIRQNIIDLKDPSGTKIVIEIKRS